AAWRGRGGGRCVELLLQPVFPGGRRITKHDFWSVSQKRIPDILMMAEDERGRRFLVLDAKYRVSRSNVLDAMTSAHVYHDSLRLGDRRPDSSMLMVPAGGGAPWLEERDFQEEHHVGVHVLCPGTSAELPGPVVDLLGYGREASGSDDLSDHTGIYT
ncbi:MAG: nuclease domain-containing protein, partial [Planctomycetota bacterium]